MSRRPKGMALAAIALAALAVIAGAALSVRLSSPQPRPKAASAPLILRRGIGAEPETLDPQTARSEAALTVLRDLYEGLTSIGADGLPAAAAAERYEVSADAKTYTFHLRAAARWSNGDPVVAEDFIAAWQHLLDPATHAPNADLLEPVLRATALDAVTLRVTLTHPAPYLLGLLAHPAAFPLNRRILAQYGDRHARPGIAVSNGAFVLVRWDFGSRIVARRNPMYWNDASTRLDGVEYHTLAEPAAELRAYRAGEIECTSTIPPAQLAWIEEHLPGELHVAPQLAVYYLGLNLLHPPFAAHPGLRRALSMVIDREKLVAAVTGGGELPAYRFTPRGIAGYSARDPDFASWPMQERIETARRLLAADGGAPPSLELRFNSGDLHARIALAVAAMWKEALHVDTHLRAEEFKVLLQDIDRGDVTQVFRASWVADYNDPTSFLHLLRSGAAINLPRYANPVYDALLADADAGADGDKRAKTLAEAERVMLGEQPLIPLYFYTSKHLVSPQVSGWRINILNIVYSKNLGLSEPVRGRMVHLESGHTLEKER